MRAAKILVLILAAAGALSAAGEGHVILISIDGFAAYHLDNSKLELPNIRALAERGARADSSETVFPSLTHPAHTTLTTGVAPRIHGVIGNVVRNRKTGETYHVTNKPRRETIRVPTLFDAAKKKGLVTAAFFWPETKGDTSIDFNLPETLDASSHADPAAADPAFLAKLRAGGVPIDFYYRWYKEQSLKLAADAVLAEAAAWTIRTHKPNLLAIHFLATDEMQHTFGAEHYLSAAALTNADRCVSLLRRAVEEAGLAASTTFFIVADHGFATVRHEVNLHPLLAEAGLAGRVALHPSGWTLAVETLPAFDAARDQAGLERFFERARRLPGVARLVRPDEMHGLGLPRYEEDPLVAGQYFLIGDVETHLVSDPKHGSTARTEKTRAYHGHGYLPGDPKMYPALIVSGARVRAGARLGHVTNYTVAPTIARLLDLEMQGFTAQPLPVLVQ
jgi:hypothetical protein